MDLFEMVGEFQRAGITSEALLEMALAFIEDQGLGDEFLDAVTEAAEEEGITVFSEG
jgi:hypothetical protein